jgi:hypothetical protein
VAGVVPGSVTARVALRSWTHRRGGAQAAADDVAHDDAEHALAGEEDVVPVTADLEHLHARAVGGGHGEAGVERGVHGQQRVLQLVRDARALLVQQGPVDRQAALLADRQQELGVERVGPGVGPGCSDSTPCSPRAPSSGTDSRPAASTLRREAVSSGSPRAPYGASPSSDASHSVAAAAPSGPTAASSRASATPASPRACDSEAVTACSAVSRLAGAVRRRTGAEQLALVPGALPGLRHRCPHEVRRRRRRRSAGPGRRPCTPVSSSATSSTRRSTCSSGDRWVSQ